MRRAFERVRPSENLFKLRFGVRPNEWHSDLSQKERRRTYRAVMKGEARVVDLARRLGGSFSISVRHRDIQRGS